MYVKQSVPRPEGNPGIGIQNRDAVVLIDVKDIAYFPPRNAAGVVIEEDIVMKPGAYPICVYMTPGSVELTAAAEGDIDQVGVKPQLKFNHPGNSREVRELKHNWINRQFITLVRYCSGKPADVIGDLCNPCSMTPSYTGNNESSSNEITVAQIAKGNDIAIYEGSIPAEEPVAVVESGATSVEYVADGQYQLTSGAAAINEIEGGRHGALVTLLGAEGTAPTVTAAEGKIMLKGGKTFVAQAGAQITLRAFEAGAGSVVWIEQSRYTRN